MPSNSITLYHGSREGIAGAIAPCSRHFLTGESSQEIYAQANADEILASYGLHTEDNRLAVEDLTRAAQSRC